LAKGVLYADFGAALDAVDARTGHVLWSRSYRPEVIRVGPVISARRAVTHQPLSVPLPKNPVGPASPREPGCSCPGTSGTANSMPAAVSATRPKNGTAEASQASRVTAGFGHHPVGEAHHGGLTAGRRGRHARFHLRRRLALARQGPGLDAPYHGPGITGQFGLQGPCLVVAQTRAEHRSGRNRLAMPPGQAGAPSKSTAIHPG
jgi:hypothetical protein